MFRRLILLLGALCLSLSCNALALDLAGRFGFAGEWSVHGSVNETAASSVLQREYSGKVRINHTATCLPAGVEEKVGFLLMRQRLGSSRVRVTLTVDGTECSFDGALSQVATSFLKCPGDPTVPIYLWALIPLV